MVTKNQVDNLLKKNLTPKEVARLLIEDAEEAVRRKSATSSLEEELTFGEAETKKLMESQNQEDQWRTGQWLEAYKTIGYNELQAKVEALGAIEYIQTLASKVKKINLIHRMSLDERARPVIMTQEEFKKKKEALWEEESKEKIPVAEAVRAKTDLLYEQETGDYPGREEEIPEEIRTQASRWILDLVKEDKLEPKELDEPIAKDKYDFDTIEDLDIDDFPFRWYFYQGELAKIENSPFSYITNFDPDRYTEKVEGEKPKGYLTPENVAIIQNPDDLHVDERGWYDSPHPSRAEDLRERLEEISKEQIEGTDKPDSLQEFYGTLAGRGAKAHISHFKAHQVINKRFYQSLGMEIQSSKDDIENTEQRLKEHLEDYNDQIEGLKWPREDKAVWHLSSGEEVEFKEIDYEAVEPSEARLEEWGGELGSYLGKHWLEKDPEDVVIA